MADVHLTLLGLGLCPADHLTLAADRALRGAREVLFVDATPGTREFLAERCPRVTDLFSEYHEGELRTGVYLRQAARVLAAALDHPPVAFAMHGHPNVFAYATRLLLDAGPKLGLVTRTLPGVSSMDVAFSALSVDPGVQGLYVVEATDLLLRQRPLLPDVPTLVWQVGNLESRLHTVRESRPERFDRFVAYLLRFYEGSHPVDLFYGSPHPLVRDQHLRIRVDELSAHADRLHPGVTLYLPPAHVRPIGDPDLLKNLDDPVHLARLVRSADNV